MPRSSILRSRYSFPGSSLASPGIGKEDRFPSGLPRLDKLLGGGFPRGAISEVTGEESSGRTGLTLSLLAEATRRDDRVAYIDTYDSLDPASARRNGVLLERLLWVRCNAPPDDQRHARALKAADILARSEGFGLLVLDWDAVSRPVDRRAERVPCSQWFRLRQLVRGKPVALLVLTRRASTGSAATLVLGLERSRVRWRLAPLQGPLGPSASPPHTRLLRGISSQARLLRGKKHGHVTVHCDF